MQKWIRVLFACVFCASLASLFVYAFCDANSSASANANAASRSFVRFEPEPPTDDEMEPPPSHSATPVCLVLACNRPYYAARRARNEATFQSLENAGFRVVYLFADPTLTEAEWSTCASTHRSTLTVPCTETYENLAEKIHLAFRAVVDAYKPAPFPTPSEAEREIDKDSKLMGVLKIDDQTEIAHPAVLYDLLRDKFRSDYCGASIGTFPKGGTVPQHTSGASAISRCIGSIGSSSTSYTVTDKIDRTVRYCAGGMYWLSLRALHILAEAPCFPYTYEDLSVGYILAQNGIQPLATKWQEKRWLRWDSDQETTVNNSEHVLFVRLSGGLGNRMFQIASAMGLARQSGRRLAFDPAINEDNAHEQKSKSKSIQQTQTETRYKSTSKSTSQSHSDSIAGQEDAWLARHLPRGNLKAFQRPIVIRERDGESCKPQSVTVPPPDFEKMNKGLGSAVLLHAYVQAFQYWTSADTQMLRELWLEPVGSSSDTHSSLKCTLRSSAQVAALSYVSSNNAFFVHVRRGDYVGNKLHDVFCGDMSYFVRGMEQFPADAPCIIVSDDIAWCKKQPAFTGAGRPSAPVPVYLGLELTALETVQVMAACPRGGVTSNSTLSWWGGFLNPSLQKRVVMPATWFRHDWNTTGIYWPGCIPL